MTRAPSPALTYHVGDRVDVVMLKPDGTPDTYRGRVIAVSSTHMKIRIVNGSERTVSKWHVMRYVKLVDNVTRNP